uniref:Uncharacterized protein n=1 Tax=Rhabditophanes sp. KR3021 TaxID=114890 RepID=A0AC35U2V2_9BILA
MLSSTFVQCTQNSSASFPDDGGWEGEDQLEKRSVGWLCDEDGGVVSVADENLIVRFQAVRRKPFCQKTQSPAACPLLTASSTTSSVKEVKEYI